MGGYECKCVRPDNENEFNFAPKIQIKPQIQFNIIANQNKEIRKQTFLDVEYDSTRNNNNLLFYQDKISVRDNCSTNNYSNVINAYPSVRSNLQNEWEMEATKMNETANPHNTSDEVDSSIHDEITAGSRINNVNVISTNALIRNYVSNKSRFHSNSISMNQSHIIAPLEIINERESSCESEKIKNKKKKARPKSQEHKKINKIYLEHYKSKNENLKHKHISIILNKNKVDVLTKSNIFLNIR